MYKIISYQILSIFIDLIKRPGHKYRSELFTIKFLHKGIILLVHNILFRYVDLSYGMMSLRKNRKIFKLILSFRRKLPQNKESHWLHVSATKILGD